MSPLQNTNELRDYNKERDTLIIPIEKLDDQVETKGKRKANNIL